MNWSCGRDCNYSLKTVGFVLVVFPCCIIISLGVKGDWWGKHVCPVWIYQYEGWVGFLCFGCFWDRVSLFNLGYPKTLDQAGIKMKAPLASLSECVTTIWLPPRPPPRPFGKDWLLTLKYICFRHKERKPNYNKGRLTYKGYLLIFFGLFRKNNMLFEIG